MIPLRLVLDTNILVSAALKPDALQRTVLLLAVTPPARLYVSDAIFVEYRAVLARPELRIRKGLQSASPARKEPLAFRHCFPPVTGNKRPRTIINSWNVPTRPAPTIW
jgi:hypothetical protein